ncbi:MAG: hypothetical protein IJG64_03520 [Oscillospiraceae bacterium]|nr:hypothetical protein [Oscillospiraceae bacterium]
MSIKIVSHRKEVEDKTEEGILARLEVMGCKLETRAKKNETAVDTVY